MRHGAGPVDPKSLGRSHSISFSLHFQIQSGIAMRLNGVASTPVTEVVGGNLYGAAIACAVVGRYS